MAGNGARKLILEDGSVYFGRGFGAETERVLEVVFNTSMAGYEGSFPTVPIPTRRW